MAQHQRAAGMLLILMGLCGCTGSSDPVSLLPASVQAAIAADRAREGQDKTALPAPGPEKAADPQTAGSAGTLAGAPRGSKAEIAAADAQDAGSVPPGPPAGPKANLQELLARARTAPADPMSARPGAEPPPGRGPDTARGGPFVPAPADALGEMPQRTAPAPATSIAAATTKMAPPTQVLPIPRAQATQKKPLDPGLKLTFAPGAKTLSGGEQSKLALAAAKAGLVRGGKVTLILGPASSESVLERLSLAQRRAQTVATLLPQGLEIVQNYQPELPADAVWVVFGARYAPEVVSQ